MHIKLSPADCGSLLVIAHEGYGVSGPIVAETNAVSGNEPGTCVYSMKIPANQSISVGVQPFRWGAGQLPADQYVKLELPERSATYNKSAPAASRGGAVAGESTFLKLDYKEHPAPAELNLPIYVNLSP
ncbi:MAG: hypothetical protein ACYDGM_05795 [Vulcanimicrobiaceae bacterium]